MRLSTFCRRKEVPWEVVVTKHVESIPMYDEDDILDVVRVGRTDVSFRFVHDVTEMKDLRRAVCTARTLLIQQLQQKGYDTLLSEGWQVTVLRRGQKHRVEVIYTGRPANVSAKSQSQSLPPFLDVLEFYRQDMYSI